MSHLSSEQKLDFERDGYIILRQFLSAKESDKLYGIAIGDDTMKKHSFDLNDQAGKKTKLALWYTPGNDAYGLLTKSKRMTDTANELMDGDALSVISIASSCKKSQRLAAPGNGTRITVTGIKMNFCFLIKCFL